MMTIDVLQPDKKVTNQLYLVCLFIHTKHN